MKSGKVIPSFKIEPGEIHVWLVDLDLAKFHNPFWEYSLSEDEVSHGMRYKFDRDRERFFARRRILRHLLARYSGMPPDEIVFNTSPNGKLSLPSNKPAFNLSASQNRVAVAFTAGEEIGIDLEQVHPMGDLQQMVDFWFSEEEKTRFSAIAAQEQLEAFFHVWTQKEAYLKAKGVGLTDGIKDFTVSVNPREPGGLSNIKCEDETTWQMVCEVPEPGWRLAVCVRMENEPEITYFSVDANELLTDY